jgi:hypothetical protein
MQIQPAYSQAKHCSTDVDSVVCATPGKNPTTERCFEGFCPPPKEITNQEAGQLISRNIHRFCAQGLAECTVTPPDR